MTATIGFFLAGFSTSYAHDLYESWMNATIRGGVLELEVTMAKATAMRLIDPARKTGELTFENLAMHQPTLAREAAALFVLTSDRRALVARQTTVELTEENDVVFKISYRRPAAGKLHFHAAFLKKLGDGYGGILEVSDTAGHHLGWEQLSFDKPNFEVVVPVVDAGTRK